MNPSSSVQPKIAEMYPGIYQPDGKTLGEGGPDLPMQPLNTLLGTARRGDAAIAPRAALPPPSCGSRALAAMPPANYTPITYTPCPPAVANSRADLAISGY